MSENIHNIMHFLQKNKDLKEVKVQNRQKLYFQDGSICTIFMDDDGKNMRMMGLNDAGKSLVRKFNRDARLAPKDSYPITKADIENWLYDNVASLDQGIFRRDSLLTDEVL